MSEYWKSTPKYWCKHCKTFVRDTKLEKQNHEATPKHQGNLQRFLRNLHRGHEREERDSQRAKAEVARLNGITGPTAPPGNGLPGRKPSISAAADGRQGGPADRKRQLQQLADMGIAVPEEARRDLAIAGDWQIQSTKPVYIQSEDMGEEELSKEDKASILAIGVRKRKHEGDEEKEEAGAVVVKKGWGSTTRAWEAGEDGDLDALLESTKAIKHKSNGSQEVSPAPETATKTPLSDQTLPQENKISGEARIKREDAENILVSAPNAVNSSHFADIPVKSEEDGAQSGVVFKKRKAKPIRQNI